MIAAGDREPGMSKVFSPATSAALTPRSPRFKTLPFADAERSCGDSRPRLSSRAKLDGVFAAAGKLRPYRTPLYPAP
jgi:hypothetical protein